MAARRESFSRGQIIEEISVESVETEESEGPEVSYFTFWGVKVLLLTLSWKTLLKFFFLKNIILAYT